MNIITALIERNIKKYFRDKGTLIFSLLSVFIVSGLYFFFLADMQVEYIVSEVGNVTGIENMIYTWIIGGLICIPAVSVPLTIVCFKVDDVESGVQNDLLVTSAKRSYIMLGYIISAWIIGFVITMITFIIGEVFIVIKGGELLSLIEALKVLSIACLTIFSFTGFSFFVIIFLRTNSSITVVNSLLNIFLGFLLGLYVPFGMLGSNVANIIKLCPLAQSASVLRQVIMKDSLDKVFQGTSNDIITKVRSFYGVDIVIGEVSLSSLAIIFILIIFGLVFYTGSIIILNVRKEK